MSEKLTQDEILNLITHGYINRNATGSTGNLSKAGLKREYGDDLSYSQINHRARNAIDSVMNKYGNPYIKYMKDGEGDGRASYLLAGWKKRGLYDDPVNAEGLNPSMWEAPEEYHHMGDDRESYMQNWHLKPTMDPDTLEIYENDIYGDWLAEMGHAMQYRGPDLPFNDPNSAWVRDSIKSEGARQTEKYGDNRWETDVFGNEYWEEGRYGIEHQHDKRPSFLDYAKNNLHKVAVSPAYAVYDWYTNSGAPTMEHEAHYINEDKIETEIKDIMDSFDE